MLNVSCETFRRAGGLKPPVNLFMNVLGYEWFIYKLKGYNENKSNFIPILIVDVDATSGNYSSWGEISISVKSTKKIPTYYGRLYEYNSIGNLEILNNKYNNDYDDYFTIKCSVGDSIVSYFDIHQKGDPSKKIYNMTNNRTGGLNKTFSMTFAPVFFHTADDYYTSVMLQIETDVYSAPNDNRKGAIPGGILNLKIDPTSAFAWDDKLWKSRDAVLRDILGVSQRVDPDNPYDGGDDKGDDDNTPGDYDHTSDPVPEPDLPSVSVTDSGLVTLFAPTESQLKALANYLWSDAFSLDSFKKMLNNPMDCILGLTIVPVNVPHGTAREITVGNIVTTVSCSICPTQYVKVDCGTFTFNRHDMTNSYLDYSPYSKCYLYLPFIGVQEINIDDFMQSTMHVVYHVDILTGAMFCYVMRDNSVMYTFMGQCAENVPLSSSSYSNTIGSILSTAASIAGVASVVATGGASAPVAAGLLGSATTSTANAVTSLKPSVAHSGSIGGGAGIMGVNYPYLIFNTPHVSIPSQQRHYTGYPSNQIVKLSALSGFNVIQAINLSVSGANDSEMNEIETILKGGVIL